MPKVLISDSMSNIAQKIFEKKEIPLDFEEEAKILKKYILECAKLENFDEFKKELMKRSALKGKKFFKPLRLLLTGQEHGPEISKLYPILKNMMSEVIR